jgi:hypothetical protein
MGKRLRIRLKRPLSVLSAGWVGILPIPKNDEISGSPGVGPDLFLSPFVSGNFLAWFHARIDSKAPFAFVLHS